MSSAADVIKVHDVVLELMPYGEDGRLKISRDCVRQITEQIYGHRKKNYIRFNDESMTKVIKECTNWADYIH